ncbi:helix-turn-helix transcriptional regulator [Streptomyces sp. H27-C3]|uniref:helix-turn-helix domain-containing protein n=1 Tax=Streptomyces sp. H27-C3 TaxID=3046305 RepID=UPI0024BB7509|nr:helix-turn-helix transcriptional regulator [Streptomyces sp. H27-C3]MDJ0461471.1 helix-turn-helix transcriptional regulator [Streptomyces sp. H27-C3]
MSLQDSQPPGTWRYCGNQVLRWRTQSGVTREELGAAANYSSATVKSMEQGVRMPTPRLLDTADALFSANGKLSAAKEYLKREKFPVRAQSFMLHELEAISVWSYEVALIPGLLQTERYVRRLIGNRHPPYDKETAEGRIAARLDRQSFFDGRPTVPLSYVVYEAALRGPGVDKGQALHLLEMGDRANISIQVLPFARAITSALNGPMLLLETRDHERYALSDGQSVSQLTSDPEVVSAHTERLSMIRAVALGPADSASFIEKMVDEL